VEHLKSDHIARSFLNNYGFSDSTRNLRAIAMPLNNDRTRTANHLELNDTEYDDGSHYGGRKHEGGRGKEDSSAVKSSKLNYKTKVSDFQLPPEVITLKKQDSEEIGTFLSHLRNETFSSVSSKGRRF
jgi:hypothetical protein